MDSQRNNSNQIFVITEIPFPIDNNPANQSYVLGQVIEIKNSKSNLNGAMQSKQDSIQVFIRVRPGEQDDSLAFTDTEIKLDRHQFAFDRIFPPQSNQDEIFDAVGHRLLTNTLDGYHGCVFVYGQTGSGKTFTMIGDNNGLMQRSFRELFVRLDSLANAETYVTCSYFELYNQQILDLLDPKKDKKLTIRQDTKKGIFVENIMEETVLTSNKLLECLQMGMRNRHVGETMMNSESSRSHTIFTISLSCRIGDDGKKVLKTPKLHFVDLAGSERQKLTSATGDRLKQAGNINKSLSTLGMVINALTSDKPRTHIPYRDSKLTCLLRDSLGGNSKTFIIATVASSVLCFQETLSTLNFANRAKMVKVRALINEESLSTNLDSYKEEIRRLKTQILRMKNERGNTEGRESSKETPNMDYHFQEINNKISVISQHLSKNVISPEFETIISRLQLAGIDKRKNTQMLDEGKDEQTQGDALMEYLNSNYELLSQVNQKVNDYLHVKHQLRMTAISGKLSIEPIKSPGKGERSQYDEILEKREVKNQEMREDIHAMHDQLTDKELRILQLTQELSHVESCQKEESENVINYRESLYSRQKQLLSFKAKVFQLEEDWKYSQEAVKERECTSKELRELYHFAEEKLENQTYLKAKVQAQYKSVVGKVEGLSTQMKDLKDKHIVEIESLKGNLETLESNEEQLTGEIKVLEETVEFHQKKVNEYSQKNKVLEICNEKLKKNIQTLSLEKIEILERINQMKFKIASMEEVIVDLELSNQRDIEKLRISEGNRSEAINELEQFKRQTKKQVHALQREIDDSTLQIQKLTELIDAQRSQIEHNQNMALSYQQKIHQLQQIQQQQSDQLHTKIATHLKLNEQISTQKTDLEFLTLTMGERIKSQSEELSLKSLEFQTLAKAFQATRAFRQENQQLRKSYQAIIKENYRLKANKDGRHESSSEELFSKVQYYQEKFRLMSMEYKKATQSVKRLKGKELQQSKIIHNLQEAAKGLAFSKNSVHLEETIHVLGEENIELKKRLSSKTSTTKSETNRQSEEKQQNLHRMFSNFIDKWSKIQQQKTENMSFQQLITAWQRIESDSIKKQESVAHGIHREQKLKTQNNFILKQNIYLKEKMNSIEQQLELSGMKNPRKIRKVNEKLGCQEPTVN